jgi:hypothetical protein
MAEDDLVVENEGKTGAGNYKVKVGHIDVKKTSFSLQYGVSGGNAYVKAFVTVKAADGTITTIYSDTAVK